MSSKTPNIPLRMRIAQILEAIEYYKELGFEADVAQDMVFHPIEMPNDDTSPQHPNCRCINP